MHSANYFDTLIRPAQDCRAETAKQPENSESVAGQQYDLMANSAYELTSDDILSQVAAIRNNTDDANYAEFRSAFFSKGQPCFRASPLTKTHGWAIHSDAMGRVSLIDPATAEFEMLENDPGITVVDAMRNRRA